MKAIYPGTFDPLTNGHLDVIKASARIFSEVTMAILTNPKKAPMFQLEKRIEMIEAVLKGEGINNVRVVTSEGLTVNLAAELGAETIIRGVRLNTDYESELFLAFNNFILNPGINTVFVPPKQEHVHISSTAVRELLNLKSEKVKEYLPISVFELIERGSE